MPLLACVSGHVTAYGCDYQAAIKVRKKSQKHRVKKVLLNQNNEKISKTHCKSNRQDLEWELLKSLYGFCLESVEKSDVASANTINSNQTNVICFCNEDEAISDEEFHETDLDYVLAKYSKEISTLSFDRKGVKKWKNNRSTRLKSFCRKIESPAGLKFEKSKTALRKSVFACKKEILRNGKRDENVKNRKENIECKLKERNIVRRCPAWQPKYEEYHDAGTSLKFKTLCKDQSQFSKRVEKQIKKLRKFVLTSSNATKGLLSSGSVKKIIALQNRDITSDDFDILIQLDLIEIKRRASRKKKKNATHGCTTEICWKKSTAQSKQQSSLSGTKHSEVKRLDKYILQINSASKNDDGDDFMNRLIELQEREITPEDFELLLQLDASIVPKTVNKTFVDCLRTEKYKIENDFIEMCSICMEDYNDGCQCKYLPCGHAFHSDCIRTWLTTTSTKCPVDNIEVYSKGENKLGVKNVPC